VFLLAICVYRLSRDVSNESWTLLNETFTAARKEVDQRTAHRLFSQRILGKRSASSYSAVNGSSSSGSSTDKAAAAAAYNSFMQAYAQLVFTRLQTCSPHFDELRELSARTDTAAAGAVLQRASAVAAAALQCGAAFDSSIENDVTCDCLLLVVQDLVEVWQLFEEGLLVLKQPHTSADVQSSIELHEFYLQHIDEVSICISTASSNNCIQTSVSTQHFIRASVK
jgi:hypothetical protein